MWQKVAHVWGVSLGVSLILISAAVPLYAGTPPVPTPEIDPASILSSLGLLAAGVMVLQARRRRR